MKYTYITRLYMNNRILVQQVPNFLFGLPKNALIKNSSPLCFLNLEEHEARLILLWFW